MQSMIETVSQRMQSDSPASLDLEYLRTSRNGLGVHEADFSPVLRNFQSGLECDD